MARAHDPVLERLLAVRQHQRGGIRSPHKPLLILLALGCLARTGSSAINWAQDAARLGELIQEFGPPSGSSSLQAAAYPFTRLRSDRVWFLNADVPMDRTGPLQQQQPVGRLSGEVEAALNEPGALAAVARALVDAEFPPTVAVDVVTAVGLDPETVMGAAGVLVAQADAGQPADRRRNPTWAREVLIAWERSCAFCGFDGTLGSASVGIEAAHVRWFAFEGPDELNNGLALFAAPQAPGSRRPRAWHRLPDKGLAALHGSH